MGAPDGIGKRASEAFTLEASQAAGAALADYGFAAAISGKLRAAGSAGDYLLSDLATAPMVPVTRRSRHPCAASASGSGSAKGW